MSRKYTRSDSRVARARSRSNANLCNSPWINELRGALDYAASKFLQRDAEVTHYAYYNAERVEWTSDTTHQRRSISYLCRDPPCTRIASIFLREPCLPVHHRRGCFSSRSDGSTREGIRVRYETIYANMYSPPPRVQYGQQATGVPDLSGVPMGGRRSFTDGPFAGQTWGVDGVGRAVSDRGGCTLVIRRGFPRDTSTVWLSRDGKRDDSCTARILRRWPERARLLHHGKQSLNLRTPPRLAHNLRGAATAPHDALDGGETQPAAANFVVKNGSHILA